MIITLLGKNLEECMMNINNSGYDASMLPNMVDYFKNN